MGLSTGSYYSIDTDNSSKAYAIAGSDSSYKYYNSMSWSMWIAEGPGVNKSIFSMYDDNGVNKRSWLFSTQSDGTFRIIGSWDGTNISLFKTANAILDFSWKHVVVTFNNGVFQCYVNGVLQSLSTVIAWGGGSVGLFAANIQIMAYNRNPSGVGVIDNSPAGCFQNFSMYNTVLSSSQVTEIYNNGAPTTLTSLTSNPNLTNWWRADQTGTSSTIPDSVASGAGMTITVSGTSGILAQSAQFPTFSSDPGVGNVLNGTTYVINGANLTGTRVAPTAAQIASAVWDEPTASHTTAGTYGVLMKKLLTLAQFLGLKSYPQ